METLRNRKNLIVIIFVLFSISCGLNLNKKSIEKMDIHGIVLEKYLDHHNHGTTTVVYEMNKVQIKFDLTDWIKDNNIWEYIQLGDSIIKPTGTLTMHIKKSNEEYKDYEYKN